MKIITSKQIIETDEILYAEFQPEENQTCGDMPSRFTVHFKGSHKIMTFIGLDAEELWAAFSREFTHPLRQYPVSVPYCWTSETPQVSPGFTYTTTTPGIKPT
jgi:hypothetical protein